MDAATPTVSVVMPTWGHEAFISRAIESLRAQTLREWELIVVDDASPDATRERVRPYLRDRRISYHRLDSNRGLGAALNVGLDLARAELIAYLPSDDVYYPNHLESLARVLCASAAASGAYSGVRHHYNRSSSGAPPGEPIQLVQVMHRRTAERWLERGELVTDDLDRMFWARLRGLGEILCTGSVTCEWVSHAGQLHRLLREPDGGINPYRSRFRVEEPLRFHSSIGNAIDERALYARFRDRPDTPPSQAALRIVLCGELAYNAERVLALEERGHQLFGLWTSRPHWWNTVGPLPFGHVRDLSPENWREELRALAPDLIYGQLNWQAVPFVHEVVTATPGIPFVWHFKESPFVCLERGTWPLLLDLYRRANGVVFCSDATRDWLLATEPSLADKPSIILDGDLPKRDWFEGPTASASWDDDEVHTVVPGRPIGLTPEVVAELAAEHIHLHFYGEFTHGQWAEWVRACRARAGEYLHLHPNLSQDRWLEEFSRYDAGWLHWLPSTNAGDVRRATWDDLNIPARMALLAACGVPVIQRSNPGHLVAAELLARASGIGVFAESIPELALQLRDGIRMADLRAHVIQERSQFLFDTHADRLLAFFRRIVAGSGGETEATAGIVPLELS